MIDHAAPPVEGTGDEVPPGGSDPAPRPLLPRLLALWALFGVGITQPILDLYGKNPEVFIAARATRTQIVVFALVATFGAVGLAALVLFVTKLLFGERVQSAVFLGLLGIAGYTAALAPLRQLFPDTDLTVLLAIVVAVGIAVLYARVNVVRMWLSCLAVLPAAALVLFLFFSESSELVWQAEAAADPSVVVDEPGAGRHARARRVPALLDRHAPGRHQRGPVPELRPAGRVVTLVPERPVELDRDDRQRADHSLQRDQGGRLAHVA